MSDEEIAILKEKLAGLQDEHRDLDVVIAVLTAQPGCDQLSLQRLKKRKLWLKDEIQRLEDQIFPDIIA